MYVHSRSEFYGNLWYGHCTRQDRLNYTIIIIRSTKSSIRKTNVLLFTTTLLLKARSDAQNVPHVPPEPKRQLGENSSVRRVRRAQWSLTQEPVVVFAAGREHTMLTTARRRAVIVLQDFSVRWACCFFFLLLVTSVSDSRLASFTISLGRNLAYDQLKKLNLGRIVNGSIYNKFGRFIKTKQIWEIISWI